MNAFEKQAQLGRNLVELNTQWIQKIAEFDGQNFQKYVEMGQEYVQKLPEVRDIQSFVDLQRSYGETLWSSTQEVVQGRTELVREAFEANGAVITEAFSPAEEAPKPKAKAKTTARKAA